jgi:hypothetical protein
MVIGRQSMRFGMVMIVGAVRNERVKKRKDCAWWWTWVVFQGLNGYAKGRGIKNILVMIKMCKECRQRTERKIGLVIVIGVW